MRHAALAAGILAGTLSAAPPQTAITNLAGRVYENAVVTETRPDGVKLRHKSGLEFVPFAELPDGVRASLGYDAKAADEYRRQQLEAAAEAQDAAARRAALASVESSGLNARIRVLQVLDGGVLANAAYEVVSETETPEYRTTTRTVGLGGTRIDNTVETRVQTGTRKNVSRYWEPLPGTVYVTGVSSASGLVDGSVVDRRIYPCGTYQYVTVSGAQATVRMYAADPALALRLAAAGAP